MHKAWRNPSKGSAGLTSIVGDGAVGVDGQAGGDGGQHAQGGARNAVHVRDLKRGWGEGVGGWEGDLGAVAGHLLGRPQLGNCVHWQEAVRPSPALLDRRKLVQSCSAMAVACAHDLKPPPPPFSP